VNDALDAQPARSEALLDGDAVAATAATDGNQREHLRKRFGRIGPSLEARFADMHLHTSQWRGHLMPVEQGDHSAAAQGDHACQHLGVTGAAPDDITRLKHSGPPG
jgi:hypothetical protein